MANSCARSDNTLESAISVSEAKPATNTAGISQSAAPAHVTVPEGKTTDLFDRIERVERWFERRANRTEAARLSLSSSPFPRAPRICERRHPTEGFVTRRLGSSAAVEHFMNGNFELAAQMFRQLADETPDNVSLLISRATCEYKLGNFNAACHLFKCAIDKDPTNHRALFDYAWLRFKKRDYAEAREFFTKIPEKSILFNRVLAPLAETLISLGDLGGARKAIVQINGINPSTAAFLYGKAAERESDYPSAELSFAEANRLGYGLEAASSRAYSLLALGADEDAINLWRACHEEKRLQFLKQLNQAGKWWVKREKLVNDLCQCTYIDQNINNNVIYKYIDIIQYILAHHDQEQEYICLQGDLLKRICVFLNQPVHLFSERWSGLNTLSPTTDWGTINYALSSSDKRYIVVDELLSAECLNYLQRFLAQSMIWYHDRDDGGYTGSYLDDGLCSEALITLAKALRVALRPTLNGAALSKAWAFRYDSDTEGISPHSDFSKITVNLWICPSEGNLDPRSGGMRLYNVCAPQGRGLYNYNSSVRWVKGFLNRLGAPTIIPHRCNRAVIFESGLLHSTDTAHFAYDYRFRRINVTFSFGYR